MSLNDILLNTRSVVQSLEVLKNEHVEMIRNLSDKLDTCKTSNKITPKNMIKEETATLRNSVEMVHLGIAEATVVIQLSNYLQSIDAEKQKIKLYVKGLRQDNAWLRQELEETQKKLIVSEANSAQMEVELSHFKFLNEIKKFDEDLNQQQINVAGDSLDGGDYGYDGEEQNNSTKSKNFFNFNFNNQNSFRFIIFVIYYR